MDCVLVSRRSLPWKLSFPLRLSSLAAIAGLTLTSACVSGKIEDVPTRDGSGNVPSQGGASAGGQPPAMGSTAGGSNPATGSTDVAPTALPKEQDCATPDNPGPRILRRLTAGEFAASIADLFGKSAPVAQVFNDSRVLGFAVDASTLRVQDLNADQLMTNAEAVADWAVTNKSDLITQLAPCGSHDAACAKTFIMNFGRKAFRSAIPENDSRIQAYSDLFTAEADFKTGVSAVISAMLQSPYFLYRSEIGAKDATGATVSLTPYEVASSLSYLLTGSMPDETLLKAADDAVKSGKADALTAMVDAQADRLLAPSGADPLAPAAQDALMNFMSGWLGLDRLYTNVKDDTVYKLTDAERAGDAAETKKFILGIWGAPTGNSVGDLFTAANSSGPESGILAQPSILIGYARANGSSPTQRGHLVRSRILCQDVPAPPAGLDTKFTPSTTLKTTREQYLEGHAAKDHQPCYGCHKLMDPIGVAFEHYDAFGRYRTEENMVTIDATGTIVPGNATDVEVAIDGLSGAKGLQTYLAQSEDVKTCLVRYWSYYAFGTADACTYKAIRSVAAADSYSLKSVLRGILHSPRFTTRVKDQ